LLLMLRSAITTANLQWITCSNAQYKVIRLQVQMVALPESY